MSSNSLRAISYKWSIFFMYRSFLCSFNKFLLVKLLLMRLLLLSWRSIKSKVFSFYLIWHFSFWLVCYIYLILLFAKAYYLLILHSNYSLLNSNFVNYTHFYSFIFFNLSIYFSQNNKSFSLFSKLNYIYFISFSLLFKTFETFTLYSKHSSVFY